MDLIIKNQDKYIELTDKYEIQKQKIKENYVKHQNYKRYEEELEDLLLSYEREIDKLL